jgi:hypothetical protein
MGLALLVILIFLVGTTLLLIPTYFVGVLLQGFIQWLVVRNRYSWSQWWLLISVVGFSLGILLDIILVIMTLLFGLPAGFIGTNVFGPLGGAICAAVAVSCAYVLVIIFIRPKIINFALNRVEGIKLPIFEVLIIVIEATAVSIPVGVVLGFLSYILLGLLIGGILFGVMSGYYFKDVTEVPLILKKSSLD